MAYVLSNLFHGIFSNFKYLCLFYELSNISCQDEIEIPVKSSCRPTCGLYRNLGSVIVSSKPELRCPLLSVAWLSSAQPCPTARGSRLLSGVNSPDRTEVVRARDHLLRCLLRYPGPPTRDKTLDVRCNRIADSILVLLPPVFYCPALPHVIAYYIG